MITNKVTSMDSMLLNCLSLKDINIDTLNLGNLSNVSNMFSCCKLIKK